jgi:hypothetical protein
MTQTDSKPGAGKGIVAAPVAAIVSSLGTLACCLPAGFLVAAGAAGAGVFFQRYRSTLLVFSLVFLALGFAQQRRGASCGMKPSRWTVALLWFSAVFVLMMLVFQQEIAGFIADRLGPGTR